MKPGKVEVPRGSPSRPTFSLLEGVPGKSEAGSLQCSRGPCGRAAGPRPWLLGSRGFPVQGERGWCESGFCPGHSLWQRARTQGLFWGGAGPSSICSKQSAASPGSVPSWLESGRKDITGPSGLQQAVVWDRLLGACHSYRTESFPVRGNSGQREEDL